LNERVAVVTTSYPRAPGDAAGHFVASEVRRLARAGYDVHVFAPGEDGRASDAQVHLHWLGDRGAFGWPGALPRLRENPTRALGMCEFALRATHALHTLGPFARLHAHFLVPCGWPVATLGFASSTLTEIELIGHGSDVRTFCRLPKSLRRRIARAWLARRVQLRVTSHELAALLSRHNPELLSALRVAPSPIDVRGVPDRTTARQTLGLEPSATIAVIVSRLIPEKRVATALRALALLSGVSIIVVGDGPELASLSTLFPGVQFTGRVTRPVALSFIAAADVLLSASPEEGAPTVVREARELGIPVVAVTAGDLATWAERDAGILLVRG